MPNAVGLLRVDIDRVDSTGKSSGQVLVPDGSGGWTSENHYTKNEVATAFPRFFHSFYESPDIIYTTYTDVSTLTVSGLTATDVIILRFTASAQITDTKTSSDHSVIELDFKIKRDTADLEEYFHSYGNSAYVEDTEGHRIKGGFCLNYSDTGQYGSVVYKIQSKKEADYTSAWLESALFTAFVLAA